MLESVLLQFFRIIKRQTGIMKIVPNFHITLLFYSVSATFSGHTAKRYDMIAELGIRIIGRWK
jgi:hypothetical protein